MIAETLTHAKEVIGESVYKKTEDNIFQDYIDYSDAVYSDAALW